MKARLQIKFLGGVLAICLLGGCATTERGKGPPLSDSVIIDRESPFVLGLDQTGKSLSKFGSEFREAALDAIESSLADRGVETVGAASAARYRIEFASVSGERDWQEQPVATDGSLSSNYKGVVLPSGVIVVRPGATDTDEFETTLEVGDYTSRVFVIDIYDLNTDALMWSGHTRRSRAELTVERIEREIAKIVAEVPIR